MAGSAVAGNGPQGLAAGGAYTAGSRPMGAMTAPMGGGPGPGASAGPMGQTAGPAGRLYGGGLLQMGMGGGDVLAAATPARRWYSGTRASSRRAWSNDRTARVRKLVV